MIQVYQSGSWKDARPHVYTNNQWVETTGYVYQSGQWVKIGEDAAPPPPPPPPPAFPKQPGVVADEDRLDAVVVGSTYYNRVLNSGSREAVSQGIYQRGSKRYSALDYNDGWNWGTGIIPGDDTRVGPARLIGNDGVAAAVQAFLWYKTGNSTYKNNAISILNGYRNITGIGNDSKEQIRLAAGWAGAGFVRAMSWLGPANYPNYTQFANMLRNVWWPKMTWWGGGNWMATFCETRLGIAVVCEDQTLFDKACRFNDAWIKANYWITSDGSTVQKLPMGPTTGTDVNDFVTGTQSGLYRNYGTSLYNTHWWQDVPNNGSSAGLINGQYCEMTRLSGGVPDDGHYGMGLGSTMSACWTAHINGYPAFNIHRTRLITAIETYAQKILNIYAAGGTPNGVQWVSGCLQALAAYGATALPKMYQLYQQRSEIRNVFTGINAQSLEGVLFEYGLRPPVA